MVTPFKVAVAMWQPRITVRRPSTPLTGARIRLGVGHFPIRWEGAFRAAAHFPSGIERGSHRKSFSYRSGLTHFGARRRSREIWKDWTVSDASPVTIIATKSRVDRAAERLIRERDRKARKEQRRRPSKADAERYETRLARLTKIHQVAFEPVDWDEIVETGPLAPAVTRDAVSQAARRRLAQYQPSLMDSLLGREREVRRMLTTKVLEAAKTDLEVYKRAKAFAEEHNRLLRLAPDIRAMKAESIGAALRGRAGVAELGEAVEGLAIGAAGARLAVRVDLLEFDALPDEACVSGPTGASYAPLSARESCELQLANACSASLRAALEILQVAPAEAVELLARICPPRGLTEAEMQPVLYLKIPRTALQKLDLRKVEAASTATAFAARIDWAAERGLAPIEVDDLALAAVGLKAAA
jgi:hypothetical protein